jgi:CRISPR/Cas system-associated protein endoribonuclease Cas2
MTEMQSTQLVPGSSVWMTAMRNYFDRDFAVIQLCDLYEQVCEERDSLKAEVEQLREEIDNGKTKGQSSTDEQYTGVEDEWSSGG